MGLFVGATGGPGNGVGTGVGAGVGASVGSFVAKSQISIMDGNKEWNGE